MVLTISYWITKVVVSTTVTVLVSVSLYPVVLGLKIKCLSPNEFYYAQPGSHCTSYYRCKNNGKEINECGPGSMFDFYKQECSRTSGTCYEPICTGRSDGVYQDTTHACRRSFTCHLGNITTIENCPPKQLHNGLTCDHQDLVRCESPRTTSIGYHFAGDNRCKGKSNGKYEIDNCNSYITCYDNETVAVEKCEIGHRFESKEQKCIPEKYANDCSTYQICNNQHDGHYSDLNSSDCRDYIICKNGKILSQERCAKGTIFNGELCVPALFYTCPLNNFNDICRNQPNGFKMNPRQGCSSFVRCMNEKSAEFYQCPNNQYFDPYQNNCAFEKFFEKKYCLGHYKSNDCNDMPEGFYQDVSIQSKCHKYFYCINNNKTEYKCPMGKIYDGENCVKDSSYTCPTDEPNSCHTKSDGYYKDDALGCRTYYYCLKGRKTIYVCEPGFIFDGTKCSRITNYKHICKSIDKICLNKSDGYYADIESNCRNYIFCSNGEKITQFTCRGSKIFNGVKCVTPTTFTCLTNQQQVSCIPKMCYRNCTKNGFYPDIDSKCRNYFFCINGKASSLSCPNGKVFNGELCVDNSLYICPKYCDESLLNLKSCPLSG